MEFSHDLMVQEVAETIINGKPDVVGLSCYIWNIEDMLRVAEIIKAILPQTLLVLAGRKFHMNMMDFYPIAII